MDIGGTIAFFGIYGAFLATALVLYFGLRAVKLI